jgi:hypothetical protein
LPAVGSSNNNNSDDDNNNLTGAAAGNIIQILANLPDFLRKPMLQKRLNEFFGMPDADRQEIIALALAAAPAIEPAKLGVLVKTWLEVLAGFDAARRSLVFETYCRQIVLQPDSIRRMNLRALTDTFLSLGERQREVLADTLKEVLIGFPRRQEVLALVPPFAKSALGL